MLGLKQQFREHTRGNKEIRISYQRLWKFNGANFKFSLFSNYVL